MPYEVGVKEVPELLVAATTRRASLATIGKEVQEAFGTLMRVVGPIGYGAGMPGVVYHEMVDEGTDSALEVFMPVARAFDPPEGVEVKTMPAATVAFTIHRGPYDRLGRAHDAVHEWIAENDREQVGAPVELYLNDPRAVGPDEALTEVRLPIR